MAKKYPFKNKNVLVMGLGRFGGGVDSAAFAAGCGADVVVTDLADEKDLFEPIQYLEKYPNIEFHLGRHLDEDFKDTDIAIVNPAVPNDNRYLQLARDNGAVVTSQVGIFFEYCSAVIVGITGSNGKSTTTALTSYILKNSNPNRKTWLSGNIGNEPLLMLLEKIKADDIVVLELSSFQIEQLASENKAPKISLITNLLPNHLDRYGTFEKYCDSKELMFANQKLDESDPAISIFNAQDELTAKWHKKYENDKGRRCLTYKCGDVPENIKSKYKLPGRFNLSNLSAALCIAKLFDISDEKIENCIADFKALPHRLQLVADSNGVKWYNDSKATTPESTIAAINAFDEPVILIAGGYDKKLPFDELGKVISEKVKHVCLIGQTAEKIKSSINKTEVTMCSDLEEAIKNASQTSVNGDIVLLSPACASYDMFENYEKRGERFTKLVNRL